MNNEYLELIKQAKNKEIQLTKESYKQIQQIYKDVAKDLLIKSKKANKGSLSERWLKDYKKAIKKDLLEVNKILYKNIENKIEKSSKLQSSIQLDFFNLIDQKYNLGMQQIFNNMFSVVPMEVAKQLINGNIYKDGRGLSKRIWFANNKVNGNIDYIINKAIIEKKSAYELSKDLETYVNPQAKQDFKWKKVYPNVGNKKVDFNAQRLARTSINHAYFMSNIRSCEKNPFVQAMHWQLSSQHFIRMHGKTDVCDEYTNSNDYNLGTGNFPINKVPLPHPQCMCTQYAVIPDSMENIGTKLNKWVNGGTDNTLNEWFNKYGQEFADESSIFDSNGKKEVKINNNIDYMSNRFVPKFGQEREFKLDKLLVKEKEVCNSEFNMWTDIDVTNKNKAVRLYEKKLKSIKYDLPTWFKLPRFSIIDFEKNGLPKNAIGGYQRQVNTIFINSKYDTDGKILKYLKNKKGYFASIESNSPLLHELGHKYHYDLVDLIANKNRISYNKAKAIFDEKIVQYIYQNDNFPDRFIENELSEYAARKFKGETRMNEIIAEYFSVKDNEQSSDLVKFIDDYVKGVIKGDGL